MKSIFPILILAFSLQQACREAVFKSVIEDKNLTQANSGDQGGTAADPDSTLPGSANSGTNSGLPDTNGSPSNPVSIPPGGGSGQDSNSSPLQVTVDKPNVTAGGEKDQATAVQADGTKNPAVTWVVTAPAGEDTGTIDANGVYTSPPKVDAPYSVTVTATLISDPTNSSSTTIVILPAPAQAKTLIATLPVAELLIGGKTTKAVAILDGVANPPVKWTVTAPSGKDAGTIDITTGVYTSPATGKDPYRVDITATLIADESIKASVGLNLKPLALTATLPVKELSLGSLTAKAKATLSDGNQNPDVTWKVTAPNGKETGTIGADGTYTSPATGTETYVVTITATLKSDSAIVSQVTLSLIPVKQELIVTLPVTEVKPGQVKLTAIATLKDGTKNPPVKWSVTPIAGKDVGTIDVNTGVYTSPAKNAGDPFNISIVAVLVADATVKGSASLSILKDDQVFVRCTKGNVVFPIVADVYSLAIDTQSLPQDFSKLKIVTTVCMDKYDVPTREFSSGFPDVPNLFEWFALHTRTTLIVPKAGNYVLRLNSDDGAKMWINNKLVLDNDGVHVEAAKESTVFFPAAGEYNVVLDYFQGPRFKIALELFWKKPGDANFEIIPTVNFK